MPDTGPRRPPCCVRCGCNLVRTDDDRVVGFAVRARGLVAQELGDERQMMNFHVGNGKGAVPPAIDSVGPPTMPKPGAGMADVAAELGTTQQIETAQKAMQEAATQGGKFGAAAEGVAHLLGEPKFLLGQTAIVLGWIGLNTIPAHKDGKPLVQFDRYPFILLTLALSLQSAYAAPFILLADRRQNARDQAANAVESAHRDALTRLELQHLGEQDEQLGKVGQATLEHLTQQGEQITELSRQNGALLAQHGELLAQNAELGAKVDKLATLLEAGAKVHV